MGEAAGKDGLREQFEEKTAQARLIEAELGDAWARLAKDAVKPGDVAAALRQFQEACRAASGLTAEQKEKLVEEVGYRFGRVAAAIDAKRDLRGLANGDEGFESLSDIAKFLGDPIELRRLVLAVVAGATIMGSVPTATAATISPTMAARTSPISIVDDSVVDAAVKAVAETKVWGPSGKADLFKRAMEFTKKWEGGKVDDPDDPGGRTKFGVTQTTFDAWRDKLSQEHMDVWEITREEADQLYESEFWAAVHGNELPERVALAVFDLSVNSSPKAAIKKLQAAVGVTADGALGPATLKAVYAQDPHVLFDNLNDSREALYNSIVERKPSQEKFKNGWMNRLNDLRFVGGAGGFESLSEDWRALIGKHPATTDPVRKLQDEDFLGTPA